MSAERPAAQGRGSAGDILGGMDHAEMMKREMASAATLCPECGNGPCTGGPATGEGACSKQTAATMTGRDLLEQASQGKCAYDEDNYPDCPEEWPHHPGGWCGSCLAKEAIKRGI